VQSIDEARETSAGAASNTAAEATAAAAVSGDDLDWLSQATQPKAAVAAPEWGWLEPQQQQPQGQREVSSSSRNSPRALLRQLQESGMPEDYPLTGNVGWAGSTPARDPVSALPLQKRGFLSFHQCVHEGTMNMTNDDKLPEKSWANPGNIPHGTAALGCSCML
jgi:hypothetical protein